MRASLGSAEPFGAEEEEEDCSLEGFAVWWFCEAPSRWISGRERRSKIVFMPGLGGVVSYICTLTFDRERVLRMRWLIKKWNRKNVASPNQAPKENTHTLSRKVMQYLT